MISLVLIILVSYLIGSIPTSIIVGKLTKGIDVRQHGSGNAGGTNAFRVLGWKAGLFVSLFDVGKGVFATVVVAGIRLDTMPISNSIWVMVIAGVCAVLGHTFTIFAGFRGGKGVATGAGMIMGLFPIVFWLCLAVFALVLLSTGIVSLSSIAAAVSLPLFLALIDRYSDLIVNSALTILSLIIPLFIIFTHRSNIGRLLRGRENRFEKVAVLRRLFTKKSQ